MITAAGAVLAAVAIAACGDTGSTPPIASRDSAASPAPPRPPKIAVTRQDVSLPRGCDPCSVALRVAGFLAAFNAGDQHALAGHLAQGTGFKWYSVTEGDAGGAVRGHVELSSVPALMEYFAERHEQSERMRLLKVDVGKASGTGTAGVGFSLLRTADDLTSRGVRNQLAIGKAHLQCPSGRIAVWSMAQPATPPREFRAVAYDVCPAPPGGFDRRRVVACAR